MNIHLHYFNLLPVFAIPMFLHFFIFPLATAKKKFDLTSSHLQILCWIQTSNFAKIHYFAYHTHTLYIYIYIYIHIFFIFF